MKKIINQDIRLKNVDETRNFFIKKIDQNELISKKYKKVFTTLSYVEDFLILVSAIIVFVSNSVFASLLDVIIGITSSSIGLRICAITTGIKKIQSTIKKKKKKYD